MNKNRLISRIYMEINGDSPCNGCKHFNKCADNKLACKDFNIFVEEGHIIKSIRRPSRKNYLIHFCD